MRVGAIDIGSNSVRLLVAEIPTGGEKTAVTAISRAGEICRLGRGLGRTGAIEGELAARAAQIVHDFHRRAVGLGAERVIVGATAALRNASNGSEVARLIESRCGLPVRILSGDDEARIVYRAVIRGIGRFGRTGQCIVFDLGGGSTEVVSGVGDMPGRWVSLPVGAVGLTERHLHGDPVTPEEVSGLEGHVRDTLMHRCAWMPDKAPLLAGVGGTITGLACLDRGLSAYDPALLEGWVIPPDRLSALVDRLVRATHAERRSWPILGEGRADIVVAGALVVRLLCERFTAPGLTCSTQGLRYGLARLAAEELGAS